MEIPLLKNVKVERGDTVEIEDRESDVDRFAEYLGYVERPTKATNLLYMAAGIFLGGMLS